MRSGLSRGVALVVLWVAMGAAVAQENEVIFNRVYLSAQAEGTVPNDEMMVMLVVEHQGKQPGVLAGKVNEDMAWALERARKNKDIRTSTEAYNTHPIYDDRLIVGWRASQQLVLKSESATGLTELVGVLQERLQVRQMQFYPTKPTRDRVVDGLIEEAMAAFKNRVKIVSGQMDEKNWRIVDLHIETGDHMVPMPMMMRAERAMAMKADMAPAVEAGTSTVTVTVSGSVQFF